MAYIPEDLVNDVLFRLPAKSLLRFRCVSKSFCAIISSPDFINSHARASSHRKLITVQEQFHPNRVRKVVYLNAIDFNNNFPKELEQCPSDFIATLDKPRVSRKYLLYRQCNGLVLFYLATHKLCVWNPSTRKFKILPTCPPCLTSDCEKTWTLGFGYDSIANDYKALVIFAGETSNILEVWILGLKSRQRRDPWRRIKENFPYIAGNDIHVSIFNRDGFADRYAVHFCLYIQDRDVSIIVRFDLNKETFSIPCETPPGCQVVGFDVFGYCLSMRYTIHDGDKDEIELYVWTLKDESDNWTKLYSIGGDQFSWLCLMDTMFLGYSDQGTNAIVLFYDEKLYSYHLKEKAVREIGRFVHKTLDCFLCVENLASLD